MPRFRVKIPPVIVAALAGLLMWALARAVPGLAYRTPARWPLAATFALGGIIVVMLGVARFLRAKTSVNPLQPGKASTLVTSGVYRVTRNPMYLGLLFVLIGVAIALEHPLAFAVLPAYVVYMNRFQIVPEETALAGIFGEAYTDYTRRVRRWL